MSDKEQVTYLTRAGLLKMNRTAIRLNLNRSVYQNVLEKETSEGTLYPIIWSMAHGNGEIRAQIAVGKMNTKTNKAKDIQTVWIDSPVEIFNKLTNHTTIEKETKDEISK